MKNINYILIFLSCFFLTKSFSQCGPTTPSFTCNLIGSPNGTWTSPSITRADSCCGSSAPDKCLKFTILLDPNAVGINFLITSGAVPPGALFYQINCGPPIAVGTPICLNGPGPHILTFCKPGNNNNTYAIVSIPAPAAPDSVLVRNGCSVTLAVTGFSVPTLNWTSVNPGPNGTYNSYLSCVSGCATVTVTPTGTPPPFVDYEVSGFAASPCQGNFYRDTIRVYFYNNLLAGINPVNPTICFGNSNVVLTATASGGLPAYTYSWSTGGNGNSITVGPGNYTVTLYDQTGCPPTTATSMVSSFTLPITANAGANQTRCKSSPVATLSGTITSASGGMWSGGTGTFSPSPSSLNVNYNPTAAELTAGSVTLYLTTTGNAGCPSDQDTIVINYQNLPIALAGPNVTVCANNSQVNLSGSITGFSSTPQWSTGGNGVFTSTANLSTTYTPGPADIGAGFVNLTLTTANNGVCSPATATLQVIITPAPVVNAGSAQTICSIGSATLNGNVSGPTITGSWATNGDGVFNPSPNILNPVYVPGPNDITTGVVTLTLMSTGNGSCFAVTNTVLINIIKIAIVNSGPSQAICSTVNSINLNGNIGGGTSTGIWGTNGSGAFNPSNSALTNTYFISVSDVTAGTIIFTLSSTNNGPCPVVTDTLKLVITKPAIVNPGPNQALCSNAGTVGLNGNVSGSSNTGIWLTGGTGTFNPSNAILNTACSITQADINTGSLTFTLSSTNNGPCPATNGFLQITLQKLAIVNAANDQTICSTATNIAITGTVGGGSNSGIWSTNGSGSFSPSNSTLNSSYNIAGQDITNGSLLLFLTSSNNGVCPAVSDTLKISIFKNPAIKLSSDTAICSYQNPVKIKPGITGNYGVIQWTTNGSGYFAPNNSSNPITYNMSISDIAAGSVTLSINTLSNGPCANLSASIKVTINPGPVADFIPSTYTANIPNDPINFSNQSTNANTYFWNFGDGSFTSISNPIHNYATVGYYTVNLIAVNKFGCSDTTQKTILVISTIQFPNVFTPNQNGSNGGAYDVNDYSNDVFFPYTSGVTEYNLKIFNRWGELIFESADIKTGWDGYFKSKLCQQDAYVWKADVKFFDGRKYNKTGNVTLLR